MARAKKETENLTVNIKSMPIRAHAGASKYINDDWGTVAFFIPRTSLGLQFADIELQYNCIYFLVGFRDLEWLAYVGQAKKRNSGGSVLKRLREHADSTTEKYRKNWDWVIIVTNKDDAWGLDDLNALENAFYHEIPTRKNLNGNTPNSAGADFNSYTDKIKQIKAYIAILGFDIFEQTEDIEKVQVTSVTNEYTIVEDLQNGMARIPEIVTPQRVVKDMVDMLEKENPDIWNPNTTFLDPACKGGEYLYEIYTRLMESETMKAKFPSDIARAVHILQNQVYGIALSQVSLDRTVNKLNGFGQNIKIIPNYISILKSKDLGTKADGKAITFKDKISEVFGKDMKFDVIIGNPPYQENTSGRNAKPLYNDFVTSLYGITAQYMCFIIPSRWVNGGIGLDSFRAFMIDNTSIQYINDRRNSDNVFKGVLISGGVMFFLINKSYCGKCTIDYTNDFGEQSRRLRYLNKNGMYIRDNLAIDIIDKINITKTLDSIMSSLNPFGIDSDMRGFTEKSSFKNHKLLSSGGIGYISDMEIEKGHEFIPYYKTVVAKALSSKPGKVLGTVAVLEPNDVCTFSYFIAGMSKSKDVVNNIATYLQTRFLRFLVFITTASINTSKKNYELVPLQDFTSNSDIDWSKSIAEIDQQLYKKYGLSAEEIEYIEKTIKPME